MAFAIWLSVHAGKKVKSADDYSVGGRNYSPVMVAGALLGTVVGGSATVGTAQMGFTLGMAACWFSFGCTAGMIILGVFYATRLRVYNISTVPEFLVFSYGKNAAPISSIISSAGIFFSIVTSIITATGLVTFFLKTSVILAIVLTIVISVALVYSGGIGGAGISGLFKMLLLAISMFVGAIIALGTIGGVVNIPQYFSAAQLDFHFSENIAVLAGMIVGIIVTQTYVQALFAARSSATAIVGACIAGVACAPIGLAAALIGMFMKVNFPHINSIDALPLFFVTYFPDWLAGLGLAALLLSVFGSIAGLALGMSTMLAQDVGAYLFNIKDGMKILRLNRFLMVFFMIVAAVFSYFQLNTMVLFWNYLSMGLRGAGIIVPFTLAVFFPQRVKSSYGFFAMIVGTIVYFIGDHIFPWKNDILSAVLVTLLICLLGFRQNKSKIKENKN